ncbi:MAG: hypothetical protein U0Z44_00460 [Kouleothrix sp.]
MFGAATFQALTGRPVLTDMWALPEDAASSGTWRSGNGPRWWCLRRPPHIRSRASPPACVTI